MQIFWDITDLSSFRMYIILLAILSFVGFQYTALYLQPPSTQFVPTGKRHILMVHVVLVLNNSHLSSDAQTVTQKASIPNISAFFDQLRKQTNFWVFVAIILLQVSTILLYY